MSVAAFETTRPQHYTLPIVRPLALPGLRRARWTVIGAITANVALWAGISFTVSAVLR